MSGDRMLTVSETQESMNIPLEFPHQGGKKLGNSEEKLVLAILHSDHDVFTSAVSRDIVSSVA